jgi:cytochrome oxidase Cu insertion factor (SCO1/SenC/PrrC family)
MGVGNSPGGSPLVAAFRTALDHQFLIILGVAAVLAVAWNVARAVQYRRALAAGSLSTTVSTFPYPEPLGRRVLRIGFGILWLFDGILQAQTAMPAGLPSGVLTPAASSSPSWVQHLVNWGATVWSDHPVTAATATVWIQVGIGVFLLVAPRGLWSRAAGVVSAGWGLVVWVVGEAFGGVLGHGSSWLFGFPGSVVFYVLAGVLIALRESSWETPRLGKGLLRGMGAFFVASGLLQAWPGRGFWSGGIHSSSGSGTLTAMIDQMARVSQPSVFSSWLRSFASFDTAHGWAVNLVVVILLCGIGACFLTARQPYLRVGAIAGGLTCLATWVLVQDFGFFGGVGTDPNSMIPIPVVFVAGYLAVVRLPVRQTGTAPVGVVSTSPPSAAAKKGILDGLSPSYLTRALAAVGAIVIVLVGAAPMALAATNGTADAIVAQVSDGSPAVVNALAPEFTLTDQSGSARTLHSYAGHTVLLTYLDPVCVTDCPIIAQELRLTDQMLGAQQASSVDLVAVVANPIYRSLALTNAFDDQEGLDKVHNWTFLTGTRAELEMVWGDYGVDALVEPGGAMVDHSDIVFLIDGHGRIREIFNADPGDGTSVDQSSFSALLAGQVKRFAHS